MPGLVRTITARLVDGPRDGHTEPILAPGPELVVVEWCPDCRRVHTHDATDGNRWQPDADLYLRDQNADVLELIGAGVSLYRWQDPALDIGDALALPVGDAVTYAGGAR